MTGHGCADCTSDLAHCHGTWLLHEDGTAACTDDGCGLDADAHVWEGRCTDVADGCGCLAAPAGRRAA